MNNLDTALAELFDLPNWRNRLIYKDINDALIKVHDIWSQDKVERTSTIEGKENRGGHNPPNTSTWRPPPPTGSNTNRDDEIDRLKAALKTMRECLDLFRPGMFLVVDQAIIKADAILTKK